MSDTITRPEYNMLSRMFAAEIESALANSKLPQMFRSKSKLTEKLHEKGMIEPVEFAMGGQLPMTFKGWVLTHSGRFTYCANC